MNVEMCQTFSNPSTGDSEQLFVAVGSRVEESIMTVTPLSYSRTLCKKTGSSDLRADFFSDEVPVAKLPSRRFSTRTRYKRFLS